MANYVKLFDSIIGSTIWQEDDATRLVWITMLARCNQHGEVYDSVPGLAHLARVSRESCEKAIAKFLSPDTASRTKHFEGRRIIEIEGGWELLNYTKYRQMANLEDQRRLATERTRRYRQRLAEKQPNPCDAKCDAGDGMSMKCDDNGKGEGKGKTSISIPQDNSCDSISSRTIISPLLPTHAEIKLIPHDPKTTPTTQFNSHPQPHLPGINPEPKRPGRPKKKPPANTDSNNGTSGNNGKTNDSTPDPHPKSSGAIYPALNPSTKLHDPSMPPVNAWSVWIDILRDRNLPDPPSFPQDTITAKHLSSVIKSRPELERTLLNFLQDSNDPWLNQLRSDSGSGYNTSLRHIQTRIANYRPSPSTSQQQHSYGKLDPNYIDPESVLKQLETQS